MLHLVQEEDEEEGDADVDDELIEVIDDAETVVKSIKGIDPMPTVNHDVRSIELGKQEVDNGHAFTVHFHDTRHLMLFILWYFAEINRRLDLVCCSQP